VASQDPRKVHFFGVWADPKAAVAEYNRQAADLHAGRQPTRSSATLSIEDLANQYLTTQQEKAKRGLITAVWFRDCLQAARAFTGFIGEERPWNDLRPNDFARYRLHLHDHFGICAIDRNITVIRVMFKHGYDMGLIERPARYGGQFNKPSLKEKRLNRSRRDSDNGKARGASSEVMRDGDQTAPDGAGL